MEKPNPLLPAEDAWAALTEASGVIWQSELRAFHENAEAYLSGRTDLGELVERMKLALDVRFDAGWLIEMGEWELYRDHTSTLVIVRGVSQTRLN
jgi:hypothetical protein